jgi:glyoxylase-like metal-dependent hydrolase (beta-lactamase superfamily II)
MVAGAGTIAISPPDGDMADYVAQLRRLLALDPQVIHPAHGLTIVDAKAKLQSYLCHRAARERQLLALMEQGEQDEEALCEGVYGALDRGTQALARGSMRALLCKLEKEGRVVFDGGARWCLL